MADCSLLICVSFPVLVVVLASSATAATRQPMPTAASIRAKVRFIGFVLTVAHYPTADEFRILKNLPRVTGRGGIGPEPARREPRRSAPAPGPRRHRLLRCRCRDHLWRWPNSARR